MTEKLKNYFLWEKECLKNANELIRKRNRQMLIMLQSAMVVSYVGLLIFSLIKNGYSSFQGFYIFLLIYMSICLVFVLKSPDMSIGYLIYGVYIVTILLCLYVSSFVDPDYINSEAYIFFLLFPVLYIDSSIRLDLVNIVLASLYLYNILEYKTGKALALESVNIVCFTLLGLAVGHFVRHRTLKDFADMEESARTDLQEAITGLPNYNCLMRDLSSTPVTPQAVVLIRIEELLSPVRSFGLDFQEHQLRDLGSALAAAAEEQGIDLYCCSGEIIGIVHPRMLDGVFQRLEPLYHTVSNFEIQKSSAEAIKLHFGIGASLCDEDIEEALEKAYIACSAAQNDDINGIMM